MNCLHCDKPVPASHMPEDGFGLGDGIDRFYGCPHCDHCFVSGRSFEAFASPDPKTVCSYCRKAGTGELRPTAGGRLKSCVPCYHQRKALVTALTPGAHKDSYTKPAADFIDQFVASRNRALAR